MADRSRNRRKPVLTRRLIHQIPYCTATDVRELLLFINLTIAHVPRQINHQSTLDTASTSGRVTAAVYSHGEIVLFRILDRKDDIFLAFDEGDDLGILLGILGPTDDSLFIVG
jgi:hypothetical protein